MTCIICHCQPSEICAHDEALQGTEAMQVVREMRTWADETVPYIRNLAQDIGVPVEKVRHILRALTDLRLATYGPLYNSDTGVPMGSSYWLTEPGAALLAPLRSA